MINITKLTEPDKERLVVYVDFSKREYGHITSWNSSSIFVRYHEIVHNDGRRESRTGTTSQATSPADLNFA